MSFYKLYFLILALFLSLVTYSQTIVPSGYISGNWSAEESPFIIRDTVVLHHDSLLNIEAGVEVIFEDTSLMVINGNLIAVGNEIDSIRFTGNSDYWSGITINTGDSLLSDSIRMGYCVFTGKEYNQAHPFGALSVVNSDKLSMMNCSFAGNKTTGAGAAVTLNHSDIFCKRTVFDANTASSDDGSARGGAIFVLESAPVLLNNAFQSNHADRGGGIFIEKGSPEIFGCEFKENQSMKHGGAIWAISSEDILLRNASCTQNYADERGGAMYLENSSAYFTGGGFVANSTGDEIASSKGGAVYLKDGNYELLGVAFSDNQSLVGGGLYTDNSSLVMDKCNFFENSSLAGGGAMVCHKSGLVDVDECNFENNTAGGSGGAVAILEGLWARFTFCSFKNNYAASDQYLSDGGGVFITPYDNLGIFVNCDFTDNVAKDFGGGAYATSISQFIGCLFNANIADTDSTGEVGGGAIALSEASFPIMNCTFVENAGGIGTTIYCEDAEFTMINSILWDDNGDPSPKIFMSNEEEITRAFIDHCNIESGNGIIRGSGEYEVIWASGNLSIDPLFETPGEDFRLSDESPCIDTARSDTLSLLLPAKDLAGNPRIFHGEIDMGCLENQTPFLITEKEVFSEFFIYPNPATRQISIRSNLPVSFSGKLEIIDLSGKVLLSEQLSFSAYSTVAYSLEALSDGLYFTRLSDTKNVYIFKLLVQQ